MFYTKYDYIKHFVNVNETMNRGVASEIILVCNAPIIIFNCSYVDKDIENGYEILEKYKLG